MTPDRLKYRTHINWFYGDIDTINIYTRTLVSLNYWTPDYCILDPGQGYIHIPDSWNNPINPRKTIIVKSILKIYNKQTTCTGAGETNGINLYVFIMARCCATTVKNKLKAKGVLVGVKGHTYPDPFLFQGIQIKPLLAVISDSSIECSWGRCPRYDETHYKYGPLIPHQFSITSLILLICGCMCTGTMGHIPRHIGGMSNNNIIIWLYSDSVFYCLLWLFYACMTWEHDTLPST